jgi:hypothetical protein
MNKIMMGLFVFSSATTLALAGTEYTGKEMRQTAVQPEECFYGDNELNVSLWGTYAFAGTDQGHIGAEGFFFGERGIASSLDVSRGDHYLQADHAWGGGIDAKYFIHKYFGIGFEGFVLDAKRTEFDFTGVPTAGGFAFSKTDDERAVGAALGTLTLRYPIGCSRFAPYVFGGFGGIFGGGERDRVVPVGGGAFVTEQGGSRAELMGNFGGGVEVRFTRHIGWINDFSWNVVDGPKNNFGMVRSGINFAF